MRVHAPICPLVPALRPPQGHERATKSTDIVLPYRPVTHEYDAAVMITTFGESDEQWHDCHLVVRHERPAITIGRCDNNVVRQPDVATLLPFSKRFDVNPWLCASHRDSDVWRDVLIEQQAKHADYFLRGRRRSGTATSATAWVSLVGRIPALNCSTPGSRRPSCSSVYASFSCKTGSISSRNAA